LPLNTATCLSRRVTGRGDTVNLGSCCSQTRPDLRLRLGARHVVSLAERVQQTDPVHPDRWHVAHTAAVVRLSARYSASSGSRPTPRRRSRGSTPRSRRPQDERPRVYLRAGRAARRPVRPINTEIIERVATTLPGPERARRASPRKHQQIVLLEPLAPIKFGPGLLRRGVEGLTAGRGCGGGGPSSSQPDRAVRLIDRPPSLNA
jgi:hypothetical protein